MAKVVKPEKPTGDGDTKPERRKQKGKALVVAWLKAKGYKREDVDKELLTDLKAGLRKLLGVSAEEYRAAGGKQ